MVALALLAAIATTARADEPKNWFDDPFFQVRDAVRDCPVPRGPLTTENEMRLSAHARAERGTRCWQEGKCAKPNAYLYDAAIADEVRRRFSSGSELQASSLWVTVQRRIVFVEGCAAAADAARRVEALLRGTEDMELVVANIARRPTDSSPYQTLKPR